MTGAPLVMVSPPPAGDAAPLTEAVRLQHPELEVAFVSGDPTAGPTEPLGIGWQRLAVALDGPRWALARGVAAARPHLEAGTAVVVLVAGSAVVVGSLIPLLTAAGPLVALARSAGPIPRDGRAPTVTDLAGHGRASTVALLLRPEGLELAVELLDLLCAEPYLATGQALDLLLHRDGPVLLDERSLAVGRWRGPEGPIALLDLQGFDPSRPWVLSSGDTPERVLLSDLPDLHRSLQAGVEQIGRPCTLRLPGAIEVDGPMGSIVAANVADHLTAGTPLCPEPFSDAPGFLHWAMGGNTGPGRYWNALLASRPDLRAAFPEIDSGRHRRFKEWADQRWRTEGSSFLLRAEGADGYEITDEGRSAGGVDVIGYLDRASGLGEAARALADALEASGLTVGRVAIGGTPSPLLDADSIPPLDQALRHDTAIVVMTAEQLPSIHQQLGADALLSRRTIGYWFWELSEPSAQARRSAAMVDEVWTATAFVRDAFDGRIATPVHLAPLPRPAPEASGLARTDLGLPDDRFVVLCSFDLFSVSERKNPLGVIDAFCLAFEPDEGPLLVIKTINGHRRWSELEHIRLAIAGRRDIRLWDETLSRADHLALVREVDCLVSLHRSEGLGLHLLEAMALGTPVVATGYSGPVDFLHAGAAEIVGYELVPVTNGEGAYAETAVWAEPDVEAAAAALRRLATDPTRRAELATAGRSVVEGLPDHRRSGEALRSLLRR